MLKKLKLEKEVQKMKKTLLSLISITALFFALAFCVCAGDVTGEIEVLNNQGDIVQTYDIVTNNVETDSRDIIQKALNYIKANASADNIHTLKLPQGSYSVYSSLNVYSNTVLDMSQSVIYRAGNCAAVIRFGRQSDVVYGYNGYKNITIKNGTIDANNVGTSGVVRFAHAYNVTISDITMQNTTDVQHVLAFAACKKVRIKNCKFLNQVITEKKEKYNCEAVQIDILESNHFEYPAQDGTRTNDVIISGCTFSNVPRGVGTHSGIAGYYFDSIKIQNNTFKNITGYAISALNYTNSEISGNKISSCGSGINCATVVQTKSKNFYAPLEEDAEITPDLNLTIKNNSISIKSKGYDHVAYGINVYGEKLKDYTDKNGNTFSGDFSISGVVIEGNTISSAVSQENTYAIYVRGAFGDEYGDESNFRISNNKVVFTNKNKTSIINHGIKIMSSSKIYISGNTIYDKKKSETNLDSGIVAEDCKYLIITSNKISNTKSFGMKFTNVSKLSVSKNTMKNNKENAIYIYTGCKKASVSSNKIYSCGGYAIAVRDAEASGIKSNSIYSSESVGIYLTGSAKCSSISGNYICDSEDRAIVLNKKASATSISKNIIDLTSSKLDAIRISDSATVSKINYNIINKKENKKSKDLKAKCRHGIYITSKSCEISEIKGNDIRKCAGNAIYLSAAKTKPKITKNSINSCKYGICYCKGTLKSNTIKKYSAAKTKKL